MNIPNAIDRNVELKGELIREGRLEKAEALSLGIEALERERYNRTHPSNPRRGALPGETEE